MNLSYQISLLTLLSIRKYSPHELQSQEIFLQFQLPYHSPYIALQAVMQLHNLSTPMHVQNFDSLISPLFDRLLQDSTLLDNNSGFTRI